MPSKPLKRRGTNPQFDEGMMLAYLELEPSFENIPALQSASMMAIIDAFDRKVERDFFGSISSTALSLHSAMGRIYTTTMLKRILATKMKDEAEPAKLLDTELDEALKALITHATMRHKELKHMAHMLAQCPTEADSIN